MHAFTELPAGAESRELVPAIGSFLNGRAFGKQDGAVSAPTMSENGPVQKSTSRLGTE